MHGFIPIGYPLKGKESEARYLLGGPTNTWGRTWNAGEFNNSNFRVRVANVASSKSRDFFLDWVSVKLYFDEPPKMYYLYDPLNRLTEANSNDGSYFHYSYDAAGNRLAETTSAGTTTYEYDIANRLTSVNGVTYTWDNNGNLLDDGVNAYTYDHANRLTGVTGTGLAASYSYNGLGDRLRQVVNGQTTEFVMDLNRGLTQVLSDGSYTYLYGHSRLGQESAAGIEYYLSDALGSVRQLADASSVTLSRAYEPYGEVLSNSGSGTTSYGFTGEWLDNQTGLIYLRARHYAPGTGRFISQDPWQGSARQPMSYNAWLYAYANPVTWMDPSGLKADDPPAPPRFGGWNSKCYPLVREDRLACEKMIRGINPDETSLSEQLILYLGSIRDCPGDFARYFNPPRLPRSYNNDTRQYGYWYHWLAENVAGWWNNQKSSHVELQQLVAIAYGREVSTLIDHEIPRIYVAEAFARKTWSEGFYFYMGSRQTVQTIVEYGLFGRDCGSEPGDRTEGCDYRYSPDKFRGQMSTQFGPSSMAYTMAESILYRTDWRRKASNRPWEFGNPTANSSQMLIRALDSKSGDSYDQVLYKSKSWLERKDTKLRTSSGTVIYDIFFIVTPGQQHNLCAGGSCIYP